LKDEGEDNNNINGGADDSASEYEDPLQ